MKEPIWEYYKVDTFDIWEWERHQFLCEISPEDHITRVAIKLEDVIFYTRKWQIDSKSDVVIVPFADVRKSKSRKLLKYKKYIERNLRNLINAKSLKEKIALDYFLVKDELFSYGNQIYINPSYRDFEFWFGLKLSQYNSGLKNLHSFYEYSLKHLYNSDYREFKRVVKQTILQYDLYTEALKECTIDWFQIKEKEKISSENLASSLTWEYGTTMDEELTIPELNNDNLDDDVPKSDFNPFDKPLIDRKLNFKYPKVKYKGIEQSKQIEGDYTTFYLKAFEKTKKIFTGYNRVKVGFTLDELIKNGFIKEGTSVEQFTAIFKEQNIKLKVVWVGTLIELKMFVQAIERANICEHLNGINKWLIAQKCFKYKEGTGDLKGKIVDISPYTRISEPSGKKDNKELIYKLVFEIKELCESI